MRGVLKIVVIVFVMWGAAMGVFYGAVTLLESDALRPYIHVSTAKDVTQ